MLFEVRNELKEFVRAQSLSLESKIDALRADNHGLKADNHDMKADIHGLKADIHGMKADIHSMKADVHAIKLLVEEQNARNRIVLDGLSVYFEKAERIELRMNRLENIKGPEAGKK